MEILNSLFFFCFFSFFMAQFSWLGNPQVPMRLISLFGQNYSIGNVFLAVFIIYIFSLYNIYLWILKNTTKKLSEKVLAVGIVGNVGPHLVGDERGKWECCLESEIGNCYQSEWGSRAGSNQFDMARNCISRSTSDRNCKAGGPLDQAMGGNAGPNLCGVKVLIQGHIYCTHGLLRID